VLSGRLAEVGGGDALHLVDGREASVLDLPPAAFAHVEPNGGEILLRYAGRTLRAGEQLLVRPAAEGDLVRFAGRSYRGTVELLVRSGQLLAINHVALEAYVAGVVGAEMGRRAPEEQSALEAQAIASRSFALALVGRARERGYDLTAGVSDQAYVGWGAENTGAREAARATRGIVATWDGAPIEAFFHSTCAGRTADGGEVFVNGALPYLRSVSDEAPDGQPWCARSPRFRWREEWTGDRLADLLGVPGSGLRDVVVTAATASGRVRELAIELTNGTRTISGASSVRAVLRPDGLTLLRSAVFRLASERRGGRLVRLVAEGAGAGHGVGLCQWGAIGRARAGQSAETILHAYYGGIRLERRW